MFYFEFFWSILIMISFLAYLNIDELPSFFIYNFGPILFGYLSFDSVYQITHKTELHEIWTFMINDENNMGIFVGVFIFLYVYCMFMMLVNLYVAHKYRNYDDVEAIRPSKPSKFSKPSKK